MCVISGTIAATALTAATSVGTAALGFAGQMAQANAQSAYQERLAEARQQQMEQNRDLAIRSMHQQVATQNQQLYQQHAAASQKAQNVQREGLERRAAMELAAMEAGVGGNNVQTLADNFRRRESEWQSSLDRQLSWQTQQAAIDRQAMKLQADGRIQSVQPYTPQPVVQPSPFSLALGLGRAGLDTQDTYNRWEGKGPYDPSLQLA